MMKKCRIEFKYERNAIGVRNTLEDIHYCRINNNFEVSSFAYMIIFMF